MYYVGRTREHLQDIIAVIRLKVDRTVCPLLNKNTPIREGISPDQHVAHADCRSFIESLDSGRAVES